MKEFDARTLCFGCKQSYMSAGFVIKPMLKQTVKQPCEICGRLGFEYEIKTKNIG